MAKPKGGARPGAGRKAGIGNKESVDRAAIVEKAISFEERCELLARLARGVAVETYDKREKNPTPIVYTEKPDANAIKELNDRQFGRAPQGLQIQPPPNKDDATPFLILAVPAFGGVVANMSTGSGDRDGKKRSRPSK